MVSDHSGACEQSVAEAFLRRMKSRGIDSLIINAGTDSAPIAEAYARLGDQAERFFPRPVLAAHENVAIGMAHGAYLVTGQPQAILVHVGVGTANALCGVINAAYDQIPVVVCAGRSPVLESGPPGSRDTRIQWGQEMFDQAGMLREQVKWDFEVRDPRHLEEVVDRAVDMATATPYGPVYLSLPRELLVHAAADTTAADPGGAGRPGATAPAPDPDAVESLVDRIARAQLPVILTTSLGDDPEAVALLAELAERFAVGVVEIEPRRMNLPAKSAAHLGFSTTQAFAAADLLCVLDCPVPWLANFDAPAPLAFVVHAAPDPLHSRYPLRSHRADMSITTGSSALLRALIDGLDRRGSVPPERSERIQQLSAAWRNEVATARDRELTGQGPITKAFASVVLSEFLDTPGRALFNEYWVRPDLLDLSDPGSYFFLPLSGGLGWGVPAAVGARYADPTRTAIAAVGDGAYMFANPAACHHAAQKHNAPFLTVIADNRSWAAVDTAAKMVQPSGALASTGSTTLSDLSPTPQLERYVEASNGVGIHVTEREALRPAIKSALSVVEQDHRQAVVRFDCAD